MNVVATYTDLYEESRIFQISFWVAVIATGAAVLQWFTATAGGPAVGPSPYATVSAGSYASPFPAGSSPQITVQPVPTPAPTPLAPPPRPELTTVTPDVSLGKGLTPKAHNGLDDVIIDTTQNSRGLKPRSHPELEGAPQQ